MDPQQAPIEEEPDTIMKEVPVVGPILNEAAKGPMFGDVAWVVKLSLFFVDRLIALVFTKECPEKISLFKQDGFDDSEP